MIKLNDRDIAQYFRRSYTATDGLWFMKVEERRGFDEALETDCEVWKVLPRIQARTLKALTRLEHGLDALFECLTTKLTLEGYLFTVVREGECSFKVNISGCPWFDALHRSGRDSIAAKVGSSICRTEYEVWAQEFDGSVSMEMPQCLCNGGEYCQIEFRQNGNGAGKE